MSWTRIPLSGRQRQNNKPLALSVRKDDTLLTSKELARYIYDRTITPEMCFSEEFPIMQTVLQDVQRESTDTSRNNKQDSQQIQIDDFVARMNLILTGRSKEAATFGLPAQDVRSESPSSPNKSKRPVKSDDDKSGSVEDPNYSDPQAACLKDAISGFTSILESICGTQSIIMDELRKVNANSRQFTREAELNHGFVRSIREGNLAEWIGVNGIMESMGAEEDGKQLSLLKERIRIQRLNIPEGYKVVVVTHPDGSEEYFRVDKAAADVSLKFLSALENERENRNNDDWRMLLHPGKSQEEVQKEVRRRPIVMNRGYSADEFDAPDDIDRMLAEKDSGNASGSADNQGFAADSDYSDTDEEEDIFRDEMYSIDKDAVESEKDVRGKSSVNVIGECQDITPVELVCSMGVAQRNKMIDDSIYYGGLMRERTQKAREEKEMIESGQMKSILEEIRKMSYEDMKALGLKRGDRARVGYRTSLGKPVMITDMRNLREMWMPSMKSAAEFLDAPYREVWRCVMGLRGQIGEYQISFANSSDAAHVMSGIYKKYMDLIQKRSEEVLGMGDSEYEDIENELAEIEKALEEKENGGEKQG